MALRGIRVGWRLVLLSGALALAAADYALRVRGAAVAGRACWMQRHARRVLRVLRVRPLYHGEPPGEGVLVSNHLGYLDILVYAARSPMVFVSKAEVARWPIFGWLSRLAGTLFIHRGRRADVARIGREMAAVVGEGTVVAFFPEGTSTGGEGVLPFHAGLLAPVVEWRWRVAPAAIRYRLPEGEGCAAQEVAYWGEMRFGPHLLRLLGKSFIEAEVCYGHAEAAGADRRDLAVRLHAEVSRLLRV